MPPVPVPVPGPAPARRPLWWDETECLTYYGMQSLHELFEVVGSQLTDTDVDVLSFLLDETCPAAHPLHPAGWTPDPAADEPEPRAGPRLLEAWRRLRPRGSPAPLAARHRPKCGVELLLELERRGYCSESRLGPLLELLRVLTRHDLLPFVSRKKRRTVSPERVSAVPVLGYGGEASVSSSQRPEKDCGGQTDLPPVCAGAQWSAGVESSRPSPSPQKRGRGRRRRGGGAAPERPGPAQGGPRPGQQRERVTCVQEPSDAQTTDSQCASPLPSRPPRPPPPLSASPEEAALRVSFCPTLPPLVSKGQRLESRRERDWVQSVFLSVRPSLRKKAHSGLLLARSQSARRQGNKKELHFVWSSAVQRYCAQRNCARCVLTCPRDRAYFVRDLAQDWPEAGISECGQAVPAVRSVLRTVLKAVLQLVSKQNPKRQKRKKKKTVLQKVASAFSFEFSEPEAHLGASPDFPELCGKGCAQAVLRVGAQSALEPVLGMIPESSCPEGFQKSLPNS
ncbi:death effector domain-containing 1 isoform X1 [Lepisosteus oculatus]|uniref:death effector domain-containing 1 isoform X1 n=1 Tax=Lepisosteus oculatus TaxID=7918 RepID=UPI0037183DFE